jgi:hypothetical protein
MQATEEGPLDPEEWQLGLYPNLISPVIRSVISDHRLELGWAIQVSPLGDYLTNQPRL